jgi:DNA repair exonuclease SbcCD ATPase subunit
VIFLAILFACTTAVCVLVIVRLGKYYCGEIERYRLEVERLEACTKALRDELNASLKDLAQARHDVRHLELKLKAVAENERELVALWGQLKPL